MNLMEGVRIALRGIMANRLRSSLTVLGIVIGVSAVIALMSVGRGAQASVTNIIQGLGSNLLFVQPGSYAQGAVRQAAGSASTLSLDDAKAIADPFSVPSVALVAPAIQTMGQLVYGPINRRTSVLGVTPEYGQVLNYVVENGDFISESQVTGRSRVAVLGSTVASDLFGEVDPIGETIKINRIPFRVGGVLKSKGGSGFSNQDNLVLVPLNTAYSALASRRTSQGEIVLQSITVQVGNDKEMAQAKEAIKQLLRQRHRIVETDDFTVMSQEDILSTMNQVLGLFTIFLGSIAGISLLVGGIGIMNIMLVSVTERTREIGIRKAIGAKWRDILTQFLVEAAVLSLGGGGVGLALGWLLSFAIGSISIEGNKIPATVSPDIVILALSVSAAIGLFFGIWPATRAARLNPIEALRYE